MGPKHTASHTFNVVAQDREGCIASCRFDTPWIGSADAGQLPPSLITPFVFNYSSNATWLRVGVFERQVCSSHDRSFFNETMRAVVRVNQDALHEIGEVFLNESVDRH